MINSLFSKFKLVYFLLITIILAGSYSYITVPKEKRPEVKIPIFYLIVNNTGISPKNADKLLVKPLEQKIITIPGIDNISSNSFEGGASSVITFKAGVDLNDALIKVKDNIDIIYPDLPGNTDKPIVKEIVLSELPILKIVLSGSVNNITLNNIADELKNQLFKVQEILDIDIIGKSTQEVQITLNQKQLQKYSLNLSNITQIIKQFNTVIPSGKISDNNSGEYKVNVPSSYNSVEDLGNTPIINSKNNIIRLKDIASISLQSVKPKTTSSYNGENSVYLSVTKRSGENIINTINKIKHVLTIAKPLLAEQGVKTAIFLDETKPIVNTIESLENNIIFSFVSVLVVIVIVMGFKFGLLTSLSIPGSFLLSMIVFKLMNIPLNMVVLFALILSIGMIVDATIITVEYAQRKIRQGLSYKEAFISSSKRMMAPIISGTLTTIGVFIPLLFWPGIVGEFMMYLPLTLIIILTSSVLMSSIIIPVIGSKFDKIKLKLRHIVFVLLLSFASYFGYELYDSSNDIIEFIIPLLLTIFIVGVLEIIFKKYNKPNKSNNKINKIDSIYNYVQNSNIKNIFFTPGFLGSYISFINNAIKYKFLTSFVFIFTFGLIIINYTNNNNGVSFFPKIEPNNAYINIYSPGNFSLTEKELIIKKAEDKLIEFINETGEITSYLKSVGKFNPEQNNIRDDKIARISLQLAQWDKRRPFQEIKNRLHADLQQIQGIQYDISAPSGGPNSEIPIKLIITASDYEKIKKYTSEIYNFMINDENFIETNTSLSSEGIDIEYNPILSQALKYGIPTNTIGMHIKMATSGIKLDEVNIDGISDPLDIVLKLPKSNGTISGIDDIKIITNDGIVPITNVVEKKFVEKKSYFSRYNGKLVEKIYSNININVNEVDAKNKLINFMKSLGTDFDYEFIGNEKSNNETKSFLVLAFFISICSIIFVLLFMFNSFKATLLICSSIPIAIIGILMSLTITGNQFSIVMSGIAIIALTGISLNNNILMIDTFFKLNQYNSNSPTVLNILKASSLRVRAIILTSVTTILGIIPISIGVSINFFDRVVLINASGSEMWLTLGQNILFGIVITTISTLILTPTLLSIAYKDKK